MIKLHDKNFELAIPHEQIVEATRGLAEYLNRDYHDRQPLLVGVLNGSFMFLAELAKFLDFKCEGSFVKVASYCGTSSSGVVDELIGLGCEVRGRDIVIVEDIVETGRSIDFVVGILREAGAASVEIATLFLKPDIYAGPHEIKYCGMPLENDFIVGFGLDYNGLGRNLRDVYRVCDEG